VSESNNSRKHELECLPLATDCMQLAGDIHNTGPTATPIQGCDVWEHSY
jgi:superoxide dismutase